MQKTLSRKIDIIGIGLHSGIESKLELCPAAAGSGVVFCRSDMAHNNLFPARYDMVVDTRNCTCLGNSSGQIVSTIEHLMSVLYILGIDNVRINVSGPELPIMDGSAKVLFDKLKDVALTEQNERRKFVRVKKEVKFVDDKGNFVILSPNTELKIDFTIDFPSKIVGRQRFNAVITPELFASEIAPARTFCEKYQVDYLQSIGLIKGGSLDNAVVLDGDTILNEGGFRVENECVKHKVLDCIGDMYTAGLRLQAQVMASCSGHFHNNEVLKSLFKNSDNYEIIEE